MTWNERLAFSMEQKDVSIADLAKATDAAHTSVMGWVGAGSVKPSDDVKATYLLKACDLLDVSPEWLMFGKLPMKKDAEWPFTTPRDLVDNISAEAMEMVDRSLFTLVEFLSIHFQENSA